MKQLLTTVLVLVTIAGFSSAKSDSKEKVIELRDALDAIITDNEHEKAGSEDHPCTFHACTAELMGCKRLKLNAHGCSTCECAEDIPVPVDLGFNVKHTKQTKRAEDVGDKGSCLLIPDAGPCKAALVRYYFDRASNRCQKFLYGGCQGNKNNFEKLEECQRTCNYFLTKSKAPASSPEKVPCLFHSCTAEILSCPEGTGLALNENGCELCECAEEGGVIEKPIPCPAHACTKEILECPGELARNKNGCELCQCADIDEEFAVHARASESTNKGICLLIPDAGPCRATHTRYYFDRSANQCKKFVYGGCHGNKNNFETQKECEISCEGGSEANNLAESPDVPCPLHSCTAAMLKCPTGLARSENGCELCECEDSGVIEKPIPCPLHSCTKEMLECPGELAVNENGCELCECAEFSAKTRSSEPTNKGICLLIPDAGPCRATHTRYYFDRAANKCKKFVYGGCHGNKNNFETQKECEISCEGGSEANNLAESPDVPCPLHSCTAEMLKCSTELARSENGCELCECEDSGVIEKPIPCPLHSCTKEMLECPGELAVNENGCELCECAEFSAKTRSSEPTNKGICLLIPDAGPCRATHTRYYFDRAANKCKKFVYGGCHGNKNNFETQKECEISCEGGSEANNLAESPDVPCPLHSCTAEMLKCPTGLARSENGCELCECEEFSAKTRSSEPTNKGICLLIPDAGPCRATHTRYYFDRAANKCKKFVYGGCHGNKNNFETQKECEISCEGGSEANNLAESPDVPCPLHSCTAEMLKCPTGLARSENGCELCECEDSGVVEKPIPCPLHGCTKEMLECPGELAVNENGCELCECAEFSAKTRSSEPTNKGICLLIPDAGPCRATHTRYYFDRAANKCKKFVYGGCHGNKNNFETQKECEISCEGGSEANNLAETPDVPCPLHSCTAEMLKCPTGLARSENGCELCECEDAGVIEKPLPCPLHGCTKEMLECPGELAVNENGCELCECAENPEPVEPTEFPPEHIEPEEDVVELTECQSQREEGLALSGKVQDGPFIPSCDDDGTFSSMQCYWDDCWCVLNPDGREVKGTRVPNSQRNTLACYEEPAEKPIPEKELDEQVARREVEAALEKMVEEANLE